ncbi:MAG TPA: zf-HC2 domain-containing protein [Gammaproteobacteria bacterium]|nr:zf-HC2 domain-containing protein [Gammaproteobacteria bacterium]
MLSCKEVSKLVSQAQDRSLTLRERISVRLHLFMCNMCRRYRRQLVFLTRAGRNFRNTPRGKAYDLPETAKARMERELAEAARRQSAEKTDG